jgi:hypothetical protein
MSSGKYAASLPRKKTIIAMLTAVMLLGTLAAPALATPQEDREALCESVSGVYDEGSTNSWNTATCTVTTTQTIVSTEQVNNIKAAKQVLRSTSTEITFETVYAFTNPGSGGSDLTGGVDGDPEVGESVMVMCTPGSGYEACPTD